MSTLKSNNVRIEGSGDEALLFVHGYGCDQTMWKFVEPEFRNDFTTVCYDLTGCGKSDISRYDFTAYATLQGHVEDLLLILAELGLSSVTLVGHSVSAMTGLMASIQAPGRFKRQIMVAPSPCYINDGDYVGGFERSEIESLLATLDLNYLGWANSMAPAIMGNRDRPELAEDLRQAFCSTDPNNRQPLRARNLLRRSPQDSAEKLLTCFDLTVFGRSDSAPIGGKLHAPTLTAK